MMFKNRWLLFLFAILIGAGLFYRSSDLSPAKTENENSISQINKANSRSPASEDPLANASTVGPTQAVPANTGRGTVTANLDSMALLMSRFTKPDSKLKDLVRELKETEQEPYVVTQNNPATGAMAIIRTKNPLNGTRYFHAQYMQNENSEEFVQHMSFEFRPGPNAMAEAMKAVESSFGNLGAPVTQKADFIRWNINEDYFVWIKKMGPSDLKDDPFNAYTADDVGTVRVAVEMEIHGDEAHH